jgi:hypothetical protein
VIVKLQGKWLLDRPRSRGENEINVNLREKRLIRAVLEKLMCPQPVTKLPHFMELKSSLPFSQKLANYLYSEYDKSSPCFHTLFL